MCVKQVVPISIAPFIWLCLFYHTVFGQKIKAVDIHMDVSQTVGKMDPLWTYFGYDEPNFTYRLHGKKLLTELAALSPTTVFVRTHNLLTSKGNSSRPDLKWGYTDAYEENEQGQPIYHWSVIDSIVDTYIERKMKPLMEIGFMPKALSTHPEPYEHTWSQGGNLWTGWTYPPKDYSKWRELIYQWVKHSIDRYGMKEVSSWLWEVWNEPDIKYWSGTFDEYCKMYDYAADGLKKACPTCVIGGPHTTSPRNDKAYLYLTNFIKHCLYGTNYATGKKGSPLQFIGFHAKGSPEIINGQIHMNMAVQLKDIQRGFEAVNSFPALKGIPIIIGECDPEGCAACSETREPKYGYRNGTMYSSYTAASFARIYELMDQYQVNLRGIVSWSFEFEDQPWFASFRDLATNGIDKPVLNVFRMLGLMRGHRILIHATEGMSCKDVINKGVRERPDVFGLASKDDKNIWLMVWNYHDDISNNQPAEIKISIKNINSKKVLVHHYRIDNTYSNSFEKWKSMNRPQPVSAQQFEILEQSGQLALFSSPSWEQVKEGQLQSAITLPAKGVSLLHLSLQ